MPKMVAPDKGLKQTDVGGYRYNVNRQGVYNVENRNHVDAMKREGFIEASMMGAVTNSENIGYTCTACGFGSFFKKCGRCGVVNDRIETDGTTNG